MGKKTIDERLRLIKMGLLTEAMFDDDEDTGGNYDLDPETSDEDSTTVPEDIDEQDEPATSDSSEQDEPATAPEDDTSTGDDAESDYSLPDTEDDTSTGDDTENTSDETSTQNNDNNTNKKTIPTEGAVLPLDEGTRKILAYKNFRKYRELEEDVTNLLSSMTDTPNFNSINSNVMETAIQKASELQTKLRDYILYRYTHTTYEINYKNFAEFIIEKRLIEDLYQTVINNSNTL